MSRYAQQFPAGDGWQSVAELQGIPGAGAALTEGFISAETNGAYVRFAPDPPDDSDVGVPVAASSAIGVGPVATRDAAYPLNEIWVRNQVAGSDATIVVAGNVV